MSSDSNSIISEQQNSFKEYSLGSKKETNFQKIKNYFINKITISDERFVDLYFKRKLSLSQDKHLMKWSKKTLHNLPRFDKDLEKYKNNVSLDKANKIYESFLQEEAPLQLNFGKEDQIHLIHVKFVLNIFNFSDRLQQCLKNWNDFIASLLTLKESIEDSALMENFQTLATLHSEVSEIANHSSLNQLFCCNSGCETKIIESLKTSNSLIENIYKTSNNSKQVCDLFLLQKKKSQEEPVYFPDSKLNLSFDPTKEHPFLDLIGLFSFILAKKKKMEKIFDSVIISKDKEIRGDSLFDKNKNTFSNLFDKIEHILFQTRKDEVELYLKQNCKRRFSIFNL